MFDIFDLSNWTRARACVLHCFPAIPGLALTGCWVPHCEVFPGHCVGLDESESSSGLVEESGPSTTSESTTSESTTSESTGTESCTMNSDCAGMTPFCDTMTGTCVECVGQAEGACAELEATTPICDEMTGACVGCQWHEECPSTACRMKTGECFPDNVIMAAGADQLDEAIAAIANLDPPMGVIQMGANSQVNSVIVPAGLTVAIVGVGQSTWQGDPNTRALTVEPDAEVYVQDVRIANTQNSSGWGIEVNGELWLDRSEVVNNAGGGVVVNGGSGVIRNCFLGSNVADVQVVYALAGGELSVTFSTLIAGPVSAGSPHALKCTAGASVLVRNSVIAGVSFTPEVDCIAAMIESSVLEDAALFPNNAEMIFAPASWPGATQLINGDFHLSGTHPPEIETAAIWQAGDPLIDIDGDPRPQDQTPTAAGADLP